ncbi:MAG: S41 family peptidase [Candidatus Binataceae bacterium]
MTEADIVPRQWQGLWRSVGYNRILEIRADGYAVYTATTRHVCLSERGSARQFAGAFDRLEINEQGHLTLFHAHDLTRYEFEQRHEWESGWRVYRTPVDDPLVNFATFCEVFAENYAFFDVRGVDWSAQCEAARIRLGPSPSPALLLDAFQDMITPFADLHVYVAAPGRKIRSMQIARGPRQALSAAFDLPTAQLSARITTEHIAARMRLTLLKDFTNTLDRFRQAGNEIVCWGTLCPGVGYLSLLRMFGFAPTETARHADDLPHRLCEVGPFMAADMSALGRILDEAMADLSEHKVLIVDVRLNAGGFDRAGMLLCERLIDRPHTVYRKKARWLQTFTDPQPLTLTPSRGPRFLKPVFLLTSSFTQSAGEVFALAMSAIPAVTILGEPTQGILSDNLFHRLPSGWEVSLSNEVYETLDGQCYEAKGVPPDVELPRLGASDLLSDLRAGLRISADRAAGF